MSTGLKWCTAITWQSYDAVFPVPATRMQSICSCYENVALFPLALEGRGPKWWTMFQVPIITLRPPHLNPLPQGREGSAYQTQGYSHMSWCYGRRHDRCVEPQLFVATFSFRRLTCK